jgi:hypothetical protein
MKKQRLAYLLAAAFAVMLIGYFSVHSSASSAKTQAERERAARQTLGARTDPPLQPTTNPSPAPAAAAPAPAYTPPPPALLEVAPLPPTLPPTSAPVSSAPPPQLWTPPPSAPAPAAPTYTTQSPPQLPWSAPPAPAPAPSLVLPSSPLVVGTPLPTSFDESSPPTVGPPLPPPPPEFRSYTPNDQSLTADRDPKLTDAMLVTSQWNTVTAWVKSYGGFVHPSVTAVYIPAYDARGIAATDSVPRETTLFKTPYPLVLSQSNVNASGLCPECFTLTGALAESIWVADRQKQRNKWYNADTSVWVDESSRAGLSVGLFMALQRYHYQAFWGSNPNKRWTQQLQVTRSEPALNRYHPNFWKNYIDSMPQYCLTGTYMTGE